MSETSARRLGRPPKGTRGDTRQELVDAALRLFAKQGYAATTVREIADEVGIRDSAIYAHFDAKQDILVALMDEAGPQVLEGLGVDFSRLSSGSFFAALPAFVNKLVDQWDLPRSRQLTSVLIREGLTKQDDMLNDLRRRLRPAFRFWRSDGQLRSDFPLDLLLWEFTAPLAAVRILYLNARTTPAERRQGRAYARGHSEFFVAGASA